MPGRKGQLFDRLRAELAKRRDVRDPAALAAWIKRRVTGTNPPLYVEPVVKGGLVRLTHGYIVGYLAGGAAERSPLQGVHPADVVGVAHIAGEARVNLYPVVNVPDFMVAAMIEDLAVTHDNQNVRVKPAVRREEAEDVLTVGGGNVGGPRRNPTLAVVGAGNPPGAPGSRREHGQPGTHGLPAYVILSREGVIKGYTWDPVTAARGAWDADGYYARWVSMERPALGSMVDKGDIGDVLPGYRPRNNPPRQRIARQVHDITYEHDDDGKDYRHDFHEDRDHGAVEAYVERGGRRVVLEATDGEPIVKDY